MTGVPSGGVRLLGAVAIRVLVAELSAMFQRSHGAAVRAEFDLNPAVAERILAGDAFDVGMTNPKYAATLLGSGRVDPGVHVPFGRIPLALARSADGGGAVAASRDDVAALLLRAGAVAYTADGTSGKTFLDVAGRLGIGRAIGPCLRPMGAGEPVAAVAAGRVELAAAPLSVVMATPGVETAAVFPPGLGTDIEMSMFLSAAPRDRRDALRLIRFLSDASIDARLEARGVGRFRFDESP